MHKQLLRERVWDDLEDAGVVRFPFPPHGRIPNFAGASDAADRLTAQPEFQRAVRPERESGPDGIDWDLLSEEHIAEIPVLERFRS
jgi:hypothetical protein